jgi:putative restriction endonuclease
MQGILTKYINAFKKLKIDRALGIAPHKPILLLAVLQPFQNRINATKRIKICPDLVALFISNWSLLTNTKHNCRFALPFNHLTSNKFWQLSPKPGFENMLKLSASTRSFASRNDAVDCAIIEDDLDVLMMDMIQSAKQRDYFPLKENLEWHLNNI